MPKWQNFSKSGHTTCLLRNRLTYLLRPLKIFVIYRTALSKNLLLVQSFFRNLFLFKISFTKVYVAHTRFYSFFLGPLVQLRDWDSSTQHTISLILSFSLCLLYVFYLYYVRTYVSKYSCRYECTFVCTYECTFVCMYVCPSFWEHLSSSFYLLPFIFVRLSLSGHTFKSLCI